MLTRRMHVLGRIGVAMVMTVMRCPPEWPALHAHGTDRSKEELHRPRGAERAMREVAVIETGQGEHAHGIQRRCYDQGHPGEANPDNSNAGDMHGNERDRAQPVDAIGVVIQRRVIRRIEPAPQGAHDTPLRLD